jgi:tripartite-type tricarboxylate transporter receptor subunit TctC
VDNIARPIATRISEGLGQPVLIDNRPGAGGGIGATAVAKSAPDGYTVMWGSAGPVAINVSLYPDVGYDPVKDFAPITLAVSTQVILTVHPKLGVNSVKELIALAKSRPGQINYASVGNGSTPHLAMELFNDMAGLKLVHVPYKGGAEAMTDLAAGRVDLIFLGVSSVGPFVKSGKLKALAVATARRAAAMPEVPTMSEAGVPGYDANSWHGVLAPARTPRPVVDQLNGVIVKVLHQPEVAAVLLQQGAEPVGSTPDEFGAYIMSEVVKWARVIKAANIKVD